MDKDQRKRGEYLLKKWGEGKKKNRGNSKRNKLTKK